MERRIIFVLVFVFTIMSTLAVGVTCWLSGQNWFTTALYTIATMWITGIVSQLLIHNLYLNIMKPIEEQKSSEDFEKKKIKFDVDDIEEINQIPGLGKVEDPAKQESRILEDKIIQKEAEETAAEQVAASLGPQPKKRF